MLPKFHTRRLWLRGVSRDDLPAIAAYAATEDYNRFIPADPPSADETRKRVDHFLRDTREFRARRLICLIAESKASGRVVGELTIARSSRGVAEIGWGIAPDCWRDGFGTEIARRGVAIGFDELGLHRIEARVAPENRASVRILERLGFLSEGLSRECRRVRGKWWSLARYAMLSREYATACPPRVAGQAPDMRRTWRRT